MKKEKTVKTYTRRLKSGKVVTVKQHTAKYDAAEALKEAAKKKGAGAELEELKKKPVKDLFEGFDFTASEFAEWYEGTGSKADKKVEKSLRKLMGRKAYDELSDNAANNYKKGGAGVFFSRNVKSYGTPFTEEVKAPKPAREFYKKHPDWEHAKYHGAQAGVSEEYLTSFKSKDAKKTEKPAKEKPSKESGGSGMRSWEIHYNELTPMGTTSSADRTVIVKAKTKRGALGIYKREYHKGYDSAYATTLYDIKPHDE